MTTPNKNRPSDLDRVLSGEAPREAARLREVWKQAQADTPGGFPDPEAIDRIWLSLDAFSHVQNGHAPPRRIGDRPPKRRLRGVARRRWMAVAAVLLIGALGAALWMRPIAQTAPPGERRTLLLSDGSRVELNSGTTIRYHRRFKREVYVEGEAFFDVAQAEAPFVVRTFNARVTVLGTRFNVRAWRRSADPSTTVALLSGRVAVSAEESPGRVVELVPGQTHRVSPAAPVLAPPDTVALRHALAWRRGELVFKDQWLGVILEDVERRFAIDLSVEPAALRRRQLTLSWRHPDDAEGIVRDVCAALDLRYRATARGFEIYAPAAP